MNFPLEETPKQAADMKRAAIDFLQKQGLILAFILLVVIFSLLSGDFLTANNITLVFRQVAIIGMIACAMTFVLIGGNFDLSVGSIVSITTLVALTLHDQIGPLPAVLITLLVGILIGSINGYLIGFLRLNSLITTLGMMSVIAAACFMYTGGKNVGIANPNDTWFSFIGKGYLFGIPFPVILFALFAVVMWILLEKTVYGRYLFAVGSNREASRFAGIRAELVTFSTFMFTGFASAVGGIILASRIGNAQSSPGEGLELEVIAAVILGGTSLMGGSGNIFKTVVAVLILGFLENGMILYDLPYYTRWIATWAIILIAVYMDVVSKRRRSFG